MTLIDTIVAKYLEHRRVMAKFTGSHYEYEFHESPYFESAWGGLDYPVFHADMETLAREYIVQNYRIEDVRRDTAVPEPHGPGHVEATPATVTKGATS